MRDGFNAITSGWTLHDDFQDITDRIEAIAAWTKVNGPLQLDEAKTVRLLIEVQIQRAEDEGIGWFTPPRS